MYHDEPKGLGHVVWCAKDKVDNKFFFILLGDYFVPDYSMNKKMEHVSREYNAASFIAVAPVDISEISQYGVISGKCVGSLSDNEYSMILNKVLFGR